jgi:hypothetical protein
MQNPAIDETLKLGLEILALSFPHNQTLWIAVNYKLDYFFAVQPRANPEGPVDIDNNYARTQ